jgi:hypothetical protein
MPRYAPLAHSRTSAAPSSSLGRRRRPVRLRRVAESSNASDVARVTRSVEVLAQQVPRPANVLLFNRSKSCSRYSEEVPGRTAKSARWATSARPPLGTSERTEPRKSNRQGAWSSGFWPWYPLFPGVLAASSCSPRSGFAPPFGFGATIEATKLQTDREACCERRAARAHPTLSRSRRSRALFEP